MRCIVTGGAGFLGSHLVEHLLAYGHEVAVIDDMFRGRQANLADCRGMEDFHLVMKDATNPDGWDLAKRKLGGVDVVYHLAAVNGTQWFHERPDLVIRVNMGTMQSALDFAVREGARLVFTSSPEAFGEQPEMPLGEESESVFTSPAHHGRHSYGASKYLCEVLVQHAVREQSLDARIVRPFNAYGPRLPGDKYGQVVSMFLEQAVAEKDITVHGDGSQTRSFTWVEEVVEGIRLAGELDQGMDGSDLRGASFNLGNPEEISIRTLAEMCAQHARDAEIEVEVVVGGEGHPGDSRRRVPDISAAETQLGWSPRISLEDGLARCWRWLLAERPPPED